MHLLGGLKKNHFMNRWDPPIDFITLSQREKSDSQEKIEKSEKSFIRGNVDYDISFSRPQMYFLKIKTYYHRTFSR